MLKNQSPGQTTCLAALVGLAVLAPPTAAETWVVAKYGVADFDELSDAVAWAAEGDTIWMRGGEYGPVQIDGKSLHVAAFGDTPVRIAGVDVLNLGADQVVSFAGVGIWREDTQSSGGLVITNCEGSVRGQDCLLGMMVIPAHDGPAVTVIQSSDVALAHCELAGGSPGSNGRAGLLNIASRVSLHGCHSSGGVGWYNAYDGGPGVAVHDALLHASGCTIRGGGGFSDDGCGPAGDGGPGILGTGSSILYLSESTVSGGHGGESIGWGCANYGEDGPTVVLEPSVSVVRLPVVRRGWSCENVTWDGGTVTIEYQGAPGDEVYITRSTGGTFAMKPFAGGVQLIDRPTTRPPFLGIAEDGHLAVELPIAEIQPTPSTASFLLQVYVITADGAYRWSDPGLLTVIDADRLAPYHAPVHVSLKAPPGGDGTSWERAYDDLQVALEETWEGCYWDLRVPRFVWLAEGRYVAPPAGPFSNDGFGVSFHGGLYGGFDGDETCLEQRDSLAHPTILTGDRLGDDAPGFQNRDDNAETVLKVKSWGWGPFVIDGLRFEGGDSTNRGGGMAVYGATTIEVRNCEFVGNRSGLGGGVYFKSPGYTNHPTATFLNCSFENNQTHGRGGGLHAVWDTTLINCSFTGNRSVTGDGGGLMAYGKLSAQNCEFVANRAVRGGALYLSSSLVPSLWQCTIRDNLGDTGAGGILGEYHPFALYNSVLWNNSIGGVVSESAQLDLLYASPEPPHYCCIDGWSGAWGGVGNHGLDPLFVNGGHLGPGSPCVDAADNAVVPADALDLDGDDDTLEPLPLDLDGNPRFTDDPDVDDTGLGPPPIGDRGAHERQ